MDQLFHPQGWDFHLKTVVAFGTAVRLRGFLGVSKTVAYSFEVFWGGVTDEGTRKMSYI
jgi:hypothetical protein